MILSFLRAYPANEKKLLWLSLALHICCAWFSVGYHYDDEHWQILEFANYRLGLSSALDLPWEFTEQIRPTLQPYLVFALAKVMMAVKMYNPFVLIFILRLMSAFLGWFATLLIIKVAKEFMTSAAQSYYLVLFASLLWFMPYMHVRFSGENWSGLFFFFGLYYLLELIESKSTTDWIVRSFFVGLCMGVSFWFRFQILFAIVGLGLWILIFKWKSLMKVVPACCGGLIVLAVGILLDHSFYDKWVFTPYNYFESNIIKNVAANYGETPWWDYFYLFILHAGIPLSVILLAMLILSIAAKPKSPYVWVLVVFLIGHMLVGHKELRFLFPMIYLLPICSFLFVTDGRIMTQLSLVPVRAGKIGMGLLIFMNSVLLAVMVFLKPPSEHIPLYQYIYNFTQGEPAEIITLHKNPYRPAWLKANYYMPRNLEVITIDSIQNIDSHLGKPGRKVLYFDDHFDIPPAITEKTDVKFELLYRNVPEFIKYLNFNGWVDRTKVYCVYRPIKNLK